MGVGSLLFEFLVVARGPTSIKIRCTLPPVRTQNGSRCGLPLQEDGELGTGVTLTWTTPRDTPVRGGKDSVAAVRCGRGLLGDLSCGRQTVLFEGHVRSQPSGLTSQIAIRSTSSSVTSSTTFAPKWS